jgi:hypothetical protein
VEGFSDVEWLTGDCPRRLYKMARCGPRDDSTNPAVHGRLLSTSCRSVFDPRISQALAAAERCADDSRAEAEANAAWDELVTSPLSRRNESRLRGEIAQAIVAVWQLLDENWAGAGYRNVQQALSHAAYLSLRDRPGEIFTGGGGDAAYWCAEAVRAAAMLRDGAETADDEKIRPRMVRVLRKIFANPSCPVTIEPSWRTATVASLAQTIYTDRAFDGLPILADALQEARCENRALLAHCLDPGPHVRGCWAVDLLLGQH